MASRGTEVNVPWAVSNNLTLTISCAAVFTKLIPLAHPHNARILTINRRDYPGSTPFTPEERALLPALSPADLEDTEKVAVSKRNLDSFAEARARELYDLLVHLVKTGNVSKPDHANNTGGIVVVGWSLGGGWVTNLLAHAPSFSDGDINLGEYVRRAVLYGTYCAPALAQPSVFTSERWSLYRCDRPTSRRTPTREAGVHPDLRHRDPA